MAAAPMPNPQASAPQPAAGAGDNPIKQVLGKVIQQVLYPLSQQNPSIQEDLSNAIRSLVSAIQKADQGASSAPQQPPAPTQQ